MFLSNFQHQLSKFLQIRPISDTKWNAESNSRILITPVGHAVGNEVGVGHDNCNIIVRYDRRAPYADLSNLSRNSADFDAVSNGYWPFGENDQAADEVADDVLQPETKANTHRSSNDGKRTEVD